MAERDRPVYCTRCGSIVHPGDRFCGVCGTRVSSAARDAGPPAGIPTQVYAPPGVSGGGNNRTLALFVGLGITVLILLAVGTVVALTLLRSGPETSGSADRPRPEPQKEAPARGAAEETGEASPSGASEPDERLGVGDSVEAEGVRATLNGVRVLPTTDFDIPLESPDNLFVAADLTFENVSDRPVAVSSLLEFVLKNEEGYSASQSIHSQQKQLAEGEISPGQKTSGEIVYEVPPGSRGLQLDYQPFLRGGVYTWYVGDADSLPGDAEPAPSVQAPEDLATSEAAVVEAAEDYYQAVDQENWAYTYENLDSQTRALFAEEEWYLKNQYFADTEGLELSTMDVVVNGSPSEAPVSVTVYRTFKDGTSITRDTLFVREDGTWKHRFTQEEIDIFMPGVPYEDFVALQ